MEVLNLFAYGTLCVPRVFRAVTGREWPAEEAGLAGYSRFRVRDQLFPGIVPDETGAVEGVLYRDLSRDVLARLDEYEADFYRRETLPVLCAGETVLAEVYVVPPEHAGLLGEEPWDLDTFRREHVDEYLHWFDD